MNTFKSTATTMALVLGLSFPAQAAKIGQTTNGEGNIVLTLEGEIKEGDADALQKLIDKAKWDNHNVVALRLNSPGGVIMEGVKIADVVADNNLATVVMNHTYCASACFLAFAASKEKIASATSGLGVHGAAEENGKESEGARAATVIMAKLLNMMHVPPIIIGKMVVTPPNEMVWLKLEDLRDWNVKVTGMPKNRN